MPIVHQDNYRIVLKPNEFQKWYKEVITKRIASKLMVCSECHSFWIGKGEIYIRDKFYYSDGFRGHTKKVVNFVCMRCWKGAIPKKVTKNWMRKPL